MIDDEDDEVEESIQAPIDNAPWQAPYAWEIATGAVDVPDAVHAAAVAWLIGSFSVPE